MTTVTALLTNRAYGYPTRGAARRRKPTVLAVAWILGPRLPEPAGVAQKDE